MALDELSRHELHTKLREALGEQAAATLMQYLPPVGWADVATKRDLDAHAVATKRDLDALAISTKRDLDALELRIRADVRSEINTAITSQTRTIMFAVLASNLTMAGIAFAAAALR